MSFQVERNRAEFEAKVEVLAAALAQDAGVVIDTDLQLVKRSGLWWCLLCLASPFFALFGVDVYSHVRIDRVAAHFLEFCKVNRRFFFEDPNLLGRVQHGFMKPLTDKVSRHFQKIQDHRDPSEFTLQLDLLAPPLFIAEQKKVQWPREGVEITEKDKTRIETAISAAKNALAQDPDCSIRFEKTGEKGARERFLVIQKLDGSVQKISVPYTLYFVEKEGRWVDIFLITKKVVGKGRERLVRQVHSLFGNQEYITKKMISREGSILTYFQKHPSRGIVTPECFRSVRAGKEHVIEPLYQGDLQDLFNKGSGLGTNQDKLSLAEDLLQGMTFLHAIPFKEMTFEFEGFSVSRKTYNVPAFHTDIKPGNVLCQFEDGRWKGALTDFSNVWHPVGVQGTVGYRPPEVVKLYNEIDQMQAQDVIDNNTRYGRASDVWSMGLVLLSILKEGSLKDQISPLPCIHDLSSAGKLCSSTAPPNPLSQSVDIRILTLSQEQVDQDLEALKSTLPSGSSLARLLDEVIKPMLQIDPCVRITAERALANLRHIVR